jgi:hypothetical protein
MVHDVRGARQFLFAYAAAVVSAGTERSREVALAVCVGDWAAAEPPMRVAATAANAVVLRAVMSGLRKDPRGSILSNPSIASAKC